MARWEIPLGVHGDGRFRLLRRDFTPAYLKSYEEGRLAEKVDQAFSHLGPSCRACPRLCRGVDRRANQFGVCKVGRHARVSSVFPHFSEEDVLRGWSGSGTIFFSWCNLRRVFCQNFETSQLGDGQELDARGLASVMIALQQRGCHNINFVTPEHVAPQIVEALPHAIRMGLHLPLVYNTSAYDSLQGLRVLDGLVDVYMPDFKLWDEGASREYLSAVNYPQVAREVIQEMHRQVGELKVDEDGLALRGVLVRHLVMPGRLDDTREIVGWLAGLSRDTYVNLMDQYYPAWKAKTNPRFAEINRRVTRPEMGQAFEMAGAGLWRLDERWRHVAPKARNSSCWRSSEPASSVVKPCCRRTEEVPQRNRNGSFFVDRHPKRMDHVRMRQDHGRLSPVAACECWSGVGPKRRARMLFMVVERFKDRDPVPIYQRLRESGGTMPEGLRYIDSWVEVNFDRCFQLMECDDAPLLMRWILQWRDLVEFEVVPVSPSKNVRMLFAGT